MRRALVLLLFSVSLAAQERFVNRELNYSVVAPQGWRWSALEDKQTWVAHGPRGERFTVYASAAARSRVDAAWLTELLPSITRDAASRGTRIEHFMQKRATAPIFPSVRYAFTRVAADGKKTFVDGWVACSGRLYSIEYASPSRESLPEFWAFVRSFQVADKFASQRAARASQAETRLNSPAVGAVLGRPMAPNGGRPVIQ
ncbi:MAG: hypothetical protein ACLGH0_10610 [Thermoanaerobaculia bacterium]